MAPGQLKGFWVGDEEKPVGSAGGQWFSPCRGALAVFIANKELTSPQELSSPGYSFWQAPCEPLTVL